MAPHEMPLISTIAVGLSVAFVFGLIAHRLRIPPIVGYLLAGVVVGPHTPGFVGNMQIAEELSEIGVVLLMFGVGLHFSFKDLGAVKNIAIPGAVGQIVISIILGTLLSQYFWNWPLTSGIMFGLALSVASTVVLLKSLEEHDQLYTKSGRIAVGWLVIEDLVMVLAIVLVPALAPDTYASNKLVLLQVAIAAAKLVLFMIFMIVAGRTMLPWIFGMVAKTGSREIFTLAVMTSAIGLAYAGAAIFDVSFALGAFFAGIMIRESGMSKKVTERSLPFQDAFAVLFFVSVGMLFNPYIIFTEPSKVMISTFIIVIGKSLAALAIVALFRYPFKTGLIVAAGLAQIGEFSFILVGLGIINGLIPPVSRDLVFAGALISIMLNPLLFTGIKAISQKLDRKH